MTTRMLLLAIVLLPSLLAASFEGELSPLEAKLQRELLAPCCYTQTLDRHMSDAAMTMKAEIHQLIASGKSERQIVEMYKSRYGERILAEPEGVTWWMLTLVPLFAMAIGAVLLFRVLNRWRGAALSAPNR